MSWLDRFKEICGFSAKLLEEFDIEVPDHVAPGVDAAIGLLKEFGKWRERKRTPLVVIEEFREKYKIDPEAEISSIEELTKKYKVPEEEINQALYRVKAKIDFPSLVSYLESSAKVSHDRLNELLGHFSKLQVALKGQYKLLSPAETVLQEPPLDSDFAIPQFFRKTGPVAADIQRGKIYIPPKVEEIFKVFEETSRLLLHGGAASGKTVVVRALAHKWFKAGRMVRFIQLKTESFDLFRLIEETAKFGEERPTPLLVLEDAHLEANLINQFLSTHTQPWPRLLVTSRMAEPNVQSQAINQFRLIKKIELQPFHAADKIISMFFKDKGWKLSHITRNQMTSHYKKNLWLLSYALKSSAESDGKKIYRESVLKGVETDLNDLMEKYENSLFPQLLTALSVLYRYEIETDLSFILQKFTEGKPADIRELLKALSRLVAMGEVTGPIKQGEHYLYGLPHSVLAELYFQFYKDVILGAHSILGDEESFICEYAISEITANGLKLPCVIPRDRHSAYRVGL